MQSSRIISSTVIILLLLISAELSLRKNEPDQIIEFNIDSQDIFEMLETKKCSRGSEFCLKKGFSNEWADINKLGFRGQMPALKHRKIVILGGNMVFNSFISEELTTCYLMQKELNRKSRGWQVLNLSVPGHNLEQQSFLFADMYSQILPDAVVYLYVPGDRNGKFSYCYKNEKVRCQAVISWTAPYYLKISPGFDLYLMRNSFLYRKFNQFFAEFSEDETPLFNYETAAVKSGLHRICELAEEKKAKLIVMYFRDRSDENLSEDEKYVLQNLCMETGVLFHDMKMDYEALQDSADKAAENIVTELIKRKITL